MQVWHTFVYISLLSFYTITTWNFLVTPFFFSATHFYLGGCRHFSFSHRCYKIFMFFFQQNSSFLFSNLSFWLFLCYPPQCSSTKYEIWHQLTCRGWTDGRTDGRTVTWVPKFLVSIGLPFFLTHGAPLRLLHESCAIKLWELLFLADALPFRFEGLRQRIYHFDSRTTAQGLK